MVTELHGSGFTGAASDLSRATLTAWWLRSSYALESRTRRILQAMDKASPVLAPGTRELVFGGNLKRRPKTRPLPPYTPGEWSRLLDACRQDIRASWRQHGAALSLAAEGSDPADGGWSPANIAWLLSRTGPVGRREVSEHLGGLPVREISVLGGVSDTRGALFPSVGTAIAYRILIGAYTGIVPDGLDSLTTGDVAWAGDQTALVSYLKGRTAAESQTLSPRASRLLRQWLEHSAPLREHAPDDLKERFWIGSFSCMIVPVTFVGSESIRRWIDSHGLLSDAGKPLSLDLRRLRTTYISERQHRGWTGRATIDPNHSPQVEGDRYLEVATPAQRAAVEDIITEAQADLIRRARPPAVLDAEATAEAVLRFPDAVGRLGDDSQALADLIGGKRDVFTAACADQLAGLHGPKGQPCPARPWVCLLCPLAVFAPRHLPNLLRLKAFFARQFQQMTTGQFAAVFGPYADRLTSEILPRFAEAAIAAAQRHVADADTELPLRAEETTREPSQ